MSMSASLHTNSGEATIQVYELEEVKTNVVSIEDKDFNQVAIFMTLEQMQLLANKLNEYVLLQGGIN